MVPRILDHLFTIFLELQEDSFKFFIAVTIVLPISFDITMSATRITAMRLIALEKKSRSG